MKKPILLHDAKQVMVYQYGTSGKITVSKRLLAEKPEELDLIEALENGQIKVENDERSDLLLDMAGLKIDAEALKAIDLILQ